MEEFNNVANETIAMNCFNKAVMLVEAGMVKLTDEMDIFQFTDVLIKLEEEKIYKNANSDSMISYDDKIVSIEDVGVLDTIDISVSGDNLFYCNGILTKNSFGVPATADLMIALISTEDLEKMGQIMIKQLKNRYNDINLHKRFVVGIDRAKMKLYDVEQSAQTLVKDIPVFDSSKMGSRMKSEGKSFQGFKV
jgi:hypothetical protein